MSQRRVRLVNSSQGNDHFELLFKFRDYGRGSCGKALGFGFESHEFESQPELGFFLSLASIVMIAIATFEPLAQELSVLHLFVTI